jgi:Fe-S-cluster containining protein
MFINEEQAELIHERMELFGGLRLFHPNKAYDIIRDKIDEYISIPEYKKQITCGSVKNCSMCCHDTIPMGLVEGEIMKKYVITNNISYNKERVLLQNTGDNLKWEDRACPLLSDINEQGERLCTIYENRPLICRTHNSSSDPAICRRDTNETTIEVMITEAMALSFIAYDLKSNRKEGEAPELTNMHTILKQIEDGKS